MPTTLPAELIDALDRFLDDADEKALAEAVAIVKQVPLDIAELLAWLERVPAPAATRRRAAATLRATLGLPVTAGAPCRKGP